MSSTGEGPVGTTPVVDDPKKPVKAVVATVIAFCGFLWSVLAGRDDLGDMTTGEWVAIIVSTLVTFGATYSLPNPKVAKNARLR